MWLLHFWSDSAALFLFLRSSEETACSFVSAVSSAPTGGPFIQSNPASLPTFYPSLNDVGVIILRPRPSLTFAPALAHRLLQPLYKLALRCIITFIFVSSLLPLTTFTPNVISCFPVLFCSLALVCIFDLPLSLLGSPRHHHHHHYDTNDRNAPRKS